VDTQLTVHGPLWVHGKPVKNLRPNRHLCDHYVFGFILNHKLNGFFLQNYSPKWRNSVSFVGGEIEIATKKNIYIYIYFTS